MGVPVIPVIRGSRIAMTPREPWTTRSEGFSSAEVCHVAGLSYRQLDYWGRSDLLVPSIRPADGSGTQRRYSFDDLIRARVIVLLHHRAAISLQRIRRALAALEGGRLTDDSTLISDGQGRVYLADSAEDAVRLGRMWGQFFAIHVGRVRADLSAVLVGDAPPPQAFVRRTGRVWSVLVGREQHG